LFFGSFFPLLEAFAEEGVGVEVCEEAVVGGEAVCVCVCV
jgi:hypothetical protein